MGFIQPCFIRKNNPKLRKKLEDLGYKYSTFDDLKLDGIITFPNRNDYSVWSNYHFDRKITLKSYIDCGTNEDLFLALAALRDDFDDENQWFVMDVEVYNHISKGEWFLSTNTQGGKHVGTQIEPLYCHKATIKEIIEYFKTK